MTKNINKLWLIAVLAAIVTNPLTGQYVQLAIELAFAQLFMLGDEVSLVAGGFTCGMIVWNMWNSRDRVNIPKHGNKPAGKYIATR